MMVRVEISYQPIESQIHNQVEKFVLMRILWELSAFPILSINI